MPDAISCNGLTKDHGHGRAVSGHDPRAAGRAQPLTPEYAVVLPPTSHVAPAAATHLRGRSLG